MTPRVEAFINLDALTHNFSVIRKMLDPTVTIMAMVKANAYGHGLIEVANTLRDADAFGVATLPEAMRLRKAGINQAIFVMCGFREPDEITLFNQYDLTAVIHHEDQITWLEDMTIDSPISIWLKCDTGMHRLGISPDNFMQSYERLMSCDYVKKPFGVMSHLSSADSDSIVTKRQLEVFKSLVDSFDVKKSIANTPGLIHFKEAHYDMVRPGLMLYGISPFKNKSAKSLGLVPVMTLKSHLISYKKISKGDYVGYGCTFKASADMTIGVVTIGYGDGYPLQADSGTPVLINGTRCQTLGKVSMDLLAVDLTPLSSVSIGDEVVLWGGDLPIEEVSKAVGTIPYDLLCRLTDRVQKEYQ